MSSSSSSFSGSEGSFSEDSSTDSVSLSSSHYRSNSSFMESRSNSSFVASSPEVIDEVQHDGNFSAIEIIENMGVHQINIRYGSRLRRGRRNADIEIFENINPDRERPISVEDDSNDGSDVVEINEDNNIRIHIQNNIDLDDEVLSENEIGLRDSDEISVNDEIGLLDVAEIISNNEREADALAEDMQNNVAEIISDNAIRLGYDVENLPENSSVSGTSLPGSSKDCPKSPVLTKIKKTNKSSDDSGDDGQTCSICFEQWSNSGEHRIASLKCGHLFGKRCIERWLKGNILRCPQCNASSNKKDIRVLYAKTIRVVDTTEKDRLSQELATVKSEKVSLERKHAKIVINNKLNSLLISQLQAELRTLKESLRNNSVETIDISESLAINNFKFVSHQSFDLSNGCRIMCYNEWLNMLIISITTTAGMFPGCGFKKINLFDMRLDKYISIHSKQIRDLAFNQLNHEIILSASMDQTVKITNVCSNANIHQYQLDSAAFSCCWKNQSATEFYVGTSTGKVLHYNTVTENPVNSFKVTGAGPVVALWYIPCIEDVTIEGLFIVRLDSICFMELSVNNKQEHKLDVEGPFTGVHYDPISKLYLINCRPSKRHPHSRHILCNLVCMKLDGNNFVELREIYTFLGSSTMKTLTKSSIIVSVHNNTWAIVNEESSLCAKIYDASSSKLVQRITFSSIVVECQFARVQNDHYIIFLTERKAHLYKLVAV